MDRREALATLSALGTSALAGCTELFDDEPAPTETPSSTSTPTEPEPTPTQTSPGLGRPYDQVSSFNYWVAPEEVKTALNNSSEPFYYTSTSLATIESVLSGRDLDVQSAFGDLGATHANVASMSLYNTVRDLSDTTHTYLNYSDLPFTSNDTSSFSIEELMHIDDSLIFVGTIPDTIPELIFGEYQDKLVGSHGNFQIFSGEGIEDDPVTTVAVSTNAIVTTGPAKQELPAEKQVEIVTSRVEALSALLPSDKQAETDGAWSMANTTHLGMSTGAIGGPAVITGGIQTENTGETTETIDAFQEMTAETVNFTFSYGTEINSEDSTVMADSSHAFDFATNEVTPTKEEFLSTSEYEQIEPDERTVDYEPPHVKMSSGWEVGYE